MFAGTMWQWNSRRQRNQCVLWPNDMQGKLEKRGKKPTSLNFFSSRTVYITIQTHTLRLGHCIVKPLYLRHDWIKRNSRYQRIWDIEFKIRTGNCGTSNLLNRHIHGICPCLKYQIWTVHVSPQNKAVLHVI